MNYLVYKFVIALVLNFVLSIPLYAEVVEQKKWDFPIKPEELMKGDIHYYFSLQTPRKILESHPEVFELDSLSLFNEPQSMMILTKAVFMVEKPIGFFSDVQMTDTKFLNHFLGEQKVKKLSPDSFQVNVPGEFKHQYKMQILFDADNLSNLPNSKISRAVAASKKLDVISQGAETIMFTELTNYSKYALGGVKATSFIPLKEDKTLVIEYRLKAVKKIYGTEVIVKPGILKEMAAERQLLNSFKN